ncbi:MAG: serine hydrolase [Chitinophagaceae bacterium]
MKRAIFIAPFLLFSFITFSQSTFQKMFPAIDKYIDSILKDWHIPGLALGIVYKDQLIYSRGYGYRNLEQKLPVEATTLFPIASNTKLFTATAAAMLEEEGQIDLDKPVRNYMPTLIFINDELNTKVTLRDMLSHRTGLPRYDAIWVGSDISRKDAISKVVYMKPRLGFREGYIYNNMMYASAGLVLETVTGKSWENIIGEKIFKPLQMNATVFSKDDMVKYGNYAIGYFEKDSTRQLLPKKFDVQSVALGPAGIIKSSVEDMSHWMIAQLNDGLYQGKQTISSKAIKETLVPNIIADKESKYDELSNALYAMGRNIETYKGYKIATHTGSVDGFYSNLTLVPALKLGVFMIHNGEAGGSLRTVMAFPVIERLLGLSITPWSQRYLADYKIAVARDKHVSDSVKATQAKGTSPSHALSSYAGTYTSPLYGSMMIELVDDGLTIAFKKIRSPLLHFHYDQFITNVEGTDLPSFRLNFLTNSKGEINSISTSLFGDPVEIFVKK